MFISRRRFEMLRWEVDACRAATSDRIEQIQLLEKRVDALEAKLSVLDEFMEMDEEDKKAEKSFLQGIQNIMNFRG